MTSNRSHRLGLKGVPNTHSPPEQRGEAILLVASVDADPIPHTINPAEGTDHKRGWYVHDRETLKRVLATRLRAALTEKGWTLSQAAQAASRYLPVGRRLRRAHLSDYVRARHFPGPQYFEALCKAFGKAPWEMLSVEGGRLSPEQPIHDVAQQRKKYRGTACVHVYDFGENAWLQVERCVPWPTALEILRLIQNCEREKGE